MFRAAGRLFMVILGLHFALFDLSCFVRGKTRADRNVSFITNLEKNTTVFFNFDRERNGNQREWYENLENTEKTIKDKADILSRLLKIHIDRLRSETNQVELVFLVDASGSVGLENFRCELNFVRKLLADFTVEPSATRVAVITFSGKRNIRRNIDQISRSKENDHKCYLLNEQLNNISYAGGGTYTRGALMEALAILENSRENAKKVVFLITDGFSNGGDPRPAANLLKSIGTTVFTFGIRTGNIEELHDIASFPGYMHSYLLDSFAEFEALARRALHRDLRTGKYVPVSPPDNCNSLCTNTSEEQNCCDDLATCTCGISTGHYACICPTGYFGSGFKGFCQPCPNGTYTSEEISGDSTSVCISCPDVNHITVKIPATSLEHCVCASGFITNGNKCEVITCPKLKIPENGYLVKASACSNVVHAACGIRCRIGFHLTGDSIRLCGTNGSWSGNEPKCLLKTCLPLRAPAHGRMRCQHEDDYQYQIKDDSTAYPIDTRCQFRCETGYQLRGSKVRNCLPLSQWDGLKATCRAIKCDPLKQIPNGRIMPEICSGPEKVPFGTNCTITCKKGFVLEGPRVRFCGGRTGVWTQRHTVNRCIDKTPPSIICPNDIILESLPGENYAYVEWTIPNVTDNTDKSPIVWTKPHVTFPWKVKIGSRSIIYIAQDSTGNKARCKFKVKVLDKEPPMIENCVSPPMYFTDNENGTNNVTWDEPGFYDNSKSPVRVEQSHRPGESILPIGLTKVVYKAIDKYDNSASCILNVTVKDICENIPEPSRGYTKCSSLMGHDAQCLLSCNEGYGFAIEPENFDVINNDLLLKCNTSDPKWKNISYVPDCSELSVPKIVSQEGNILLEGNETTVCDNQTTLRELSNYITDDLRSKLLDICGNDIECDLVTFDPECKDDSILLESAYLNITRKRRQIFNFNHFYNLDSFSQDNTDFVTFDKIKRAIRMKDNMNGNKMRMKKKKERIEIKFKFVGKIIDENLENPREGVQKLRQKIESLSQSGKLNLLNNRTNQEIAKLALNLHVIFKNPQELCDPGSTLRKHSCVKCPRGTFYNFESKRCYPCPFGQYQDKTGSLECKDCPENSSTRKMHAKSPQDCLRMCKPGHYSRRKRYHGSHVALEPCLMCDIGFYQPKYGQAYCLPCPFNTSTSTRGSTDIKDCVSINIVESNVCQTIPCLNGGQCVEEEDSFTCECPDRYIGSKCETFQNPCDSSPCLNEGICSIQNTTNNSTLYLCTCKTGYKGDNCELYIDECAINPCQNHGKCVSTDSDYACECKAGFEGEFCEIAIDHCNPSPCEEGSTCRIINETWQCFCRPGFLGRHCNLLPCDWLPCHTNAICVNIEEENATRMSYRCECPEGYTGENCTTKIDYCENSPCGNNGKCIGLNNNYFCSCFVPFTGRNCDTEMPSDYVLHFTKAGTTDYVRMEGPSENLAELTACLWLQSKDTFNYGTVLSYATRYYDNAFTLTDYNGFVLYVNGHKVVTDVKVNDGRWHFLCTTWESKNGNWAVFVDGIMKDNGTRLAKSSVIQGNGSLVIGQEQDRVGGGFSASESFLGKLSLLDVWDVILNESDIKYMTNTCDKYHGNVIAWSQMQEYVHGDVSILDSKFCRGCPVPKVPFKGNINVSEDLTEITYYCDTGYIVRFYSKEYRHLKLNCLKQGQWEGYYTPTCTRKKCGFPGYFPRGHIRGRSYLFGDEIYYSCMSGYELRGNPHRICNSEGKWSGLPPICIGKTCKNLLAPENGDIEYVIEENERDDISILQAGQQLEFKCDPGFDLVGEKFLTCLESGVWDNERPTCVSFGCPPPKEIKGNYIISENLTKQEESKSNFTLNPTNNTLRDIYYHGDTLEFSCQQDYKFDGNENLLAEIKLECSENGTWIGIIPDCIPLQCPWPTNVEKGRTFLMIQNNTSIEILSNKTLIGNTTKLEFAIQGNDTHFDEDKIAKDFFTPGARISVICDYGYELIGEQISTCTKEENWLPVSPFCKPRECPIERHLLFRFFTNFENETISENSTKVSLEDQKKKWNDIKNSSGSYRNLKYFIEGNTYTERIIVTCKNNRNIELNVLSNETLSNITWSCNANGEWEISSLTINSTAFETVLNNTVNDLCHDLMCTSLTVPQYGYIVDSKNATNYSRTINSTITFKCRNGYILEGNEKSICLSNASWSDIPSCKPVKCGKPPTLQHAELKEVNTEGRNYTFGNTVSYKCVPGYLMFGLPSTRCLANGKWSRMYSKCSKLSCNKPKLPPGVTVQGRSYLYQDKLSYICPNGNKRGYITCKADGKWSDFPTCNGN